MIPVVYDKNDLQCNSNGLGRLTDCIECTVENNADDYSCELHIVYPMDGSHVELLDYANVIGVQVEPHGNIQLFDVYKIGYDESGNKTADAHHVRHRLKYLPTTWVYGNNIADIIRSLNMVHIGAKLGTYGSYASEAGTKNFGFHNPFTFWTNITRDSLFYQITYVNETAQGNVAVSSEGRTNYALVASTDVAQSFWDVVLGKDGLVTVYGLSIKFDNFDIYISEPDALSANKTNEVFIRYGRDIRAFSVELDSSDFELYTHAIPYRKTLVSGQEDVEVTQFFMSNPLVRDSFPVVYEIPDVPLEISAKRYLTVDISKASVFRAKYGYYVIGTEEGFYRSVITAEHLESITKAMAKQANAEKVSPSFEIDMISFRESSIYTNYESLESVGLSDVVSVLLDPVNLVVEEQILKTEYNVLGEMYDSITVGMIRNNVADILVALAEHEEDNKEFDSYLDYNEELTPYTTENELTDYNDGETTWKLSYTYYEDDTRHTVESEPIRTVGNMITGNLVITKSGEQVTLVANQRRKILEGLPIPMLGSVHFSFPETLRDTVNNQWITVDCEFDIDENGDLFITSPETGNTGWGDYSDGLYIIYLNFQYLSAENNYDKSWKNYITTDNIDWKEREPA